MEEKTPEKLVEEAEAKKKAKEAREKYMAEVKTAINAAGENTNVRIVLRHFMNVCGYNANPSVLGNNADIQVSSTVYNVGRQSTYHDLRKLMSAETKNVIERSE